MGLGKVFKAIGRGSKKVVGAPVALVEKGKEVIVVKVVMGIARHLLTAAGGAVVSKGLASGNDVDIVVGALVTIIGVVASVLAKRQGIEVE